MKSSNENSYTKSYNKNQIDDLSFYIYLNPNPSGGARSGTAAYEWLHVKFIFDRVKNNLIVPTGADQHRVIGSH